MSEDPPQDPPPLPKEPSPETEMAKISPELLAQLFAASAVLPAPEELPGGGAGGAGGGSLRKKLLVAIAIAAIGVGASIMSCVGQSFSYRQARAMEGIEQQLKEIRASCPAIAPLQPTGEGSR